MKKFNITVSLDTGCGYETIKTLNKLSAVSVIKDLEDSFEVLNNSDYFGIDVGNNQKEEYAKGLSYIITESKGGK